MSLITNVFVFMMHVCRDLDRPIHGKSRPTSHKIATKVLHLFYINESFS